MLTGTWQHVAVTLSGNTGALYVNGQQVGQHTIDGIETVEVTVAAPPVGGLLFVRVAAQ